MALVLELYALPMHPSLPTLPRREGVGGACVHAQLRGALLTLGCQHYLFSSLIYVVAAAAVLGGIVAAGVASVEWWCVA